LGKSVLHQWHEQHGARMTEYGTALMPFEYGLGHLQEYKSLCEGTGLVDLSFLSHIEVSGPCAKEELEKLIPLDLEVLPLSTMAYSVLPVSNSGPEVALRVCRRNRDNFILAFDVEHKDRVVEHLVTQLETSPLHLLDDLVILGLYGPGSGPVLSDFFHDEIDNLQSCEGMLVKFSQTECFLQKVEGELPGFELSVPAGSAEVIAGFILDSDKVQPVGVQAWEKFCFERSFDFYRKKLSEASSDV